MHCIPIIGSNTHNNISPGGDGQTGDDGTGKGGNLFVLFFCFFFTLGNLKFSIIIY